MIFFNYILLLTLSTHYVWTAMSELDNRIEGFKKSKMTILSHQDQVANAFIRKFESNKQKSADQNKTKEVPKTLEFKNGTLLNNETMDKEIENPIENLLERVQGMKLNDHEHPNLKIDDTLRIKKEAKEALLKKDNESKEQEASKNPKKKGDEISDEKETKKSDNTKNLIANVLHENHPNSVKSLGIYKDLSEKKESGQEPKTDVNTTPSQIETGKIHGASTSYGDFQDSSENKKSHENHKPTQPLNEENRILKSSAEYAEGKQDLSEQKGSDEKINNPIIVIEKGVAKNFRQNRTREPSVEISKGIQKDSIQEGTQKEQLPKKSIEVPETLKLKNEVLPNNETVDKEIENPIEKLLERVQGMKLSNHEHPNLKIDENKRIKQEAKKALLKRINESKEQEASKENDNMIEKLLERVQDMKLSNHEHPNLKIDENKRIKQEAKEALLKRINESKEQEASKENDNMIEKLLERVQGRKLSNHEYPNLKIDETKRMEEEAKEPLLKRINESKVQEASKENDNPIEKLLERVQGMKLSNHEHPNLKIDETKRMEEEAREAFLKKINESKEKGVSKEIEIADEQFCQTNNISDYDKICGHCINNSDVMRSLNLVYDESRKHEVDHKCIFKNVQICKLASNKSKVFKKMCAFSKKNELQNSKNGIIEPLSYRQAVLPCPVKKRLLPNDVIAGRYYQNEIYYVANGSGRSCFILKDSKNEISILSYVKNQIQSINNLLNRDIQKSHSPKGQMSQNTDPSPVLLHGRLENSALFQNTIQLPKNVQIDQLPPRIGFSNLKPKLQQIRTSNKHLGLKGPIKDKLNDIFLDIKNFKAIKNDLKEKSKEIHNQSRDIKINSHGMKKDFKNFKNSTHERSTNESEKNRSPIFKRIAESKLKNNSWNTSIDVDYIKRLLSEKRRQNQKNELKDDHQIVETEKNNVNDTRVHEPKKSSKSSPKNSRKSSRKNHANKRFDFYYPKKQADKNLTPKNNAPRRRRIRRRRVPKMGVPPIIKRSDDLIKPKNKNVPEGKTDPSRNNFGNINENSNKSSCNKIKFENISKKVEEAGETIKQLENDGILKDKNFSSKLNDIAKKLKDIKTNSELIKSVKSEEDH